MIFQGQRIYKKQLYAEIISHKYKLCSSKFMRSIFKWGCHQKSLRMKINKSSNRVKGSKILSINTLNRVKNVCEEYRRFQSNLKYLINVPITDKYFRFWI